MTKYFLSESNSDAMLAGSKARSDVDEILSSSGFQPLCCMATNNRYTEKTSSLFAKVKEHFTYAAKVRCSLKKLIEGDSITLQYPLICNYLLVAAEIRHAIKRGVAITLILHDAETFRYAHSNQFGLFARYRIIEAEKAAITNATVIISHNKRMSNALIDAYALDDNKLVELCLFDYLVKTPEKESAVIPLQNLERERCIAIAGNLIESKAGYAYKLPKQGRFVLYGPNWHGEDRKNCSYSGSVSADSLPDILDADFGLVWDGPLTETCDGFYGQYLKINNPHKASLYLAAGIPLIVWKESALADLVSANQVGIVVASIQEAVDFVNRMPDSEYFKLKRNAEYFKIMIRNGEFTKRALDEAARRIELSRSNAQTAEEIA